MAEAQPLGCVAEQPASDAPPAMRFLNVQVADVGPAIVLDGASLWGSNIGLWLDMRVFGWPLEVMLRADIRW